MKSVHMWNAKFIKLSQGKVNTNELKTVIEKEQF
jgi:hypothetical protein